MQNSNFKKSIKWIENIPKNWEVLPVRALLEERKEKNIDGNVDNILSVMKDVGVIRYADKGNVGNKSSERPEGYKKVYKNDIVINSMNLVIGSVGLSHENGVTSSVYIIYKLKNKNNDIKYFYDLFRSKPFQRHLGTFGRGMMELRESVKAQDIKNQLIPVPDPITQGKISDYLNKKTKIIDQIVKKKQKLIELLKEKRMSIITKAVTKGLDPNAKMKSSGVKLFGDIPNKWEISRFKAVLKIMQGAAFKSGEYVQQSNVVSIRMGNIKKGGFIDLDHNTKFLPENYANEYKKYILKEGDIIIAMTDMSPSLEFLAVPAQMTTLNENTTYLLNQRVGKLHINKKIQLRFLKYVLLSDTLRSQLKSLGLGTVQSNMASYNLYDSTFILPPTEDQRMITNYLDSYIEKFDLVILSINNQLNKLNEYRSSLIYNAVTGKIKI